jgi:hypothetical protein
MFTAVEAEVLGQFLEDLSEHMAHAGCNDYCLRNTAEYREFIRKVLTCCLEPKDLEREIKDTLGDREEKEIFTVDMMVLEYIMQRLKEERILLAQEGGLANVKKSKKTS